MMGTAVLISGEPPAPMGYRNPCQEDATDTLTHDYEPLSLVVCFEQTCFLYLGRNSSVFLSFPHQNHSSRPNGGGPLPFAQACCLLSHGRELCEAGNNHLNVCLLSKCFSCWEWRGPLTHRGMKSRKCFRKGAGLTLAIISWHKSAFPLIRRNIIHFLQTISKRGDLYNMSGHETVRRMWAVWAHNFFLCS